MKLFRQLLLACSVLLVLIPFRFAEAQEQVMPEVGRTYAIPKPVQPLATNFKPIEQVSLSVVAIPNPCSGGCGYAPANCTEHAALLREQAGIPVGSDWGDARFWPAKARAAGIEVTDKPSVGDVAISEAGAYGHAMYVKAIFPDGSFLVSEQNYDFNGSIRDRVVHSPAGLSFIYF